MLKKTSFIIFAFALIFILVSCNSTEPKTKTFYTYFDTVITVYSYGQESKKNFDDNCSQIEIMLDKYNRLFDIYHEYSGLNNLCTVNKNAGTAITVDSEIIELLHLAKNYYELSNYEVNVMMGAVLKQWHHTITETGVLPDNEELQKASKFCSFDNLVIDDTNNTILLKNKNASIDVGAIAKGFAVEKIANYLEQKGSTSYAINAGGNVRLIGEKPKDKDWSVAIQNPNGNGYAAVLKLHNTSCVTSGIYERNVEIEGKEYHHIIDKDTLIPASFFSSVSVITKDSGYADALSTALFCMSYEDGLNLQKQLGNFDVLWILSDGNKLYTEGLKNYVVQE